MRCEFCSYGDEILQKHRMKDSLSQPHVAFVRVGSMIHSTALSVVKKGPLPPSSPDFAAVIVFALNSETSDICRYFTNAFGHSGNLSAERREWNQPDNLPIIFFFPSCLSPEEPLSQRLFIHLASAASTPARWEGESVLMGSHRFALLCEVGCHCFLPLSKNMIKCTSWPFELEQKISSLCTPPSCENVWNPLYQGLCSRFHQIDT